MSPGPDRTGVRVGVVIPAAGSGRRMGGRKKPYVLLDGEPLLVHALRPFLARNDVVSVRVAVAPDDLETSREWLEDGRIGLVAGGATRSESVRAALDATPPEVNVIVVHDAARPLLAGHVVERCIREAVEGRGAVAGVPATDTLKRVDGAGRVLGTPERASLWHAQTPQAFPAELIRRAYASSGSEATDDAALVEALGATVVMVEGTSTNLKVTRPEDVALAEFLLAGSREG